MSCRISYYVSKHVPPEADICAYLCIDRGARFCSTVMYDTYGAIVKFDTTVMHAYIDCLAKFGSPIRNWCIGRCEIWRHNYVFVHWACGHIWRHRCYLQSKNTVNPCIRERGGL